MSKTNDLLSIQRIFSAPSLSGTTFSKPRFNFDSTQVAYLKADEATPKTLDLWLYDIKNKTKSCLINSAEFLGAANTELTDEEKARRERQRIDSSGIVEFLWSPSQNSLLFSLNGALYEMNVDTKENRQISATQTDITDFKYSPRGQWISWISGQNIWAQPVESSQAQQLTHDGQGLIKNGMAEFVAQEEMARFTGYWWSPDESKIAYTQIDESPVQISKRLEVYADRFDVIDQRYPMAGTPNVSVKLGTLPVQSPSQTTWFDLSSPSDFYLARVNWFKDSKTVALLVQQRDQKKQWLYAGNSANGSLQTLLQEEQEPWLNLNNGFRSLAENRFLWISEQSGFQHLYLHDDKGKLMGPITKGDWVVSDIKRVCEKTHTIWFTGYKDTPLESHLYSIDTNPETDIQTLTEPGFHHDVIVSRDSRFFISIRSNKNTPPQMGLYHIDGQQVDWIEENAVNATHPWHAYQDKVPVEFGTLTAEDGQTLHYQLRKPQTQPDQKVPVVIYVYGGPHAKVVRNSWGKDTELWMNHMVQKGYGVLSLDNRGSTERGIGFESAIAEHMGHHEVQDQKKLAEFAGSLDWVDSKRIGIFGWSYGGFMTLMCLLKEPDTFSVGVSVAPVTDWRLYDTHYTERYLGHPETHPEAYKKSQCLSLAKNLKGKLKIIHGMADDNVLYTHSTKMYAALQKEGRAFDIMAYPGAKHGIYGKENRIHVYEAITGYFDLHL